MKKILFIFIILFVSACVPSGPSLRETELNNFLSNLKSEDYGTKPNIDSTKEKEKVENIIKDRLKDSESAKFKNWQTWKTYLYDGPYTYSKLTAGWIVSVDVNGKNSYGGYTGYSSMYVFYKNNKPYCVVDDSCAKYHPGGINCYCSQRIY